MILKPHTVGKSNVVIPSLLVTPGSIKATIFFFEIPYSLVHAEKVLNDTC